MLGASAFLSIIHSILKLLSQKLVCMSIFDIQKYIPNFFLKNCPKWPNSEKGLKLAYARKIPFFDWKTSFIYEKTHFGLKNGTKFKNSNFFNFWSKYFEKCLINHYFWKKLQITLKWLQIAISFSRFKDMTFSYINS